LIRAGVTEIEGEKELYSSQSKTKEPIPGFALIPKPTASRQIPAMANGTARKLFPRCALLVHGFFPLIPLRRRRRQSQAERNPVTSTEALQLIPGEPSFDAAS
jgi:hypothetical protein